MNYFELFDLAVGPTVDKTTLSSKYFSLQKSFHPDFFSQATESEKEEALEKSAAINTGYTIFQDDEKTLEYYLRLKEVIKKDEKYDLPPDFLMEMMELNENLMEGDNSEEQVNTYIAGLKGEIEPILMTQKTSIDNAEQEKLKSYYYKKKYLQRILDRLAD